MRRQSLRTGLGRKNKDQRYKIRNWVNKLPETPAFILGNAPSLKNHDLSKLAGYFTIGINRAFYLLDPTILFWQDISLWTTEYHKLHNLQAIKVCRDVADPKRLYYNFYLKGGPYFFDKSKTHVLFGRGSSGPLAVQLAVSMGCNPIILLGMNCRKTIDGKTDFYGNNQHWLPYTLINCDAGLQFLKENCPVDIISCDDTDYWPKQELDDILNKLKQHNIGRQTYVHKILDP